MSCNLTVTTRLQEVTAHTTIFYFYVSLLIKQAKHNVIVSFIGAGRWTFGESQASSFPPLSVFMLS